MVGLRRLMTFVNINAVGSKSFQWETLDDSTTKLAVAEAPFRIRDCRVPSHAIPLAPPSLILSLGLAASTKDWNVT